MPIQAINDGRRHARALAALLVLWLCALIIPGHAQTSPAATRLDTTFGVNGSVDFTLNVPAIRQVEATVLRKAPEVIFRYGFEGGDRNRPLLRAVAPDGTVRVPAASEFVDDHPSEQFDPCPAYTQSSTCSISVFGAVRLVAASYVVCTRGCTVNVGYFLEQNGVGTPIATVPGALTSVGPKAVLGPDNNLFFIQQYPGYNGAPVLRQYRPDGALVGELVVNDTALLTLRFEMGTANGLQLLEENNGRVTRLFLPYASFLDRTTWRSTLLADISDITNSYLFTHWDQPGGKLLLVRTLNQLIKMNAQGRPDPAYGQNGVVNIPLQSANQSPIANGFSLNPLTGEFVSRNVVVDRNGVRRDIQAEQLIDQSYRFDVAMTPRYGVKDGQGNLLLSLCNTQAVLDGFNSNYRLTGSAVVRLKVDGSFDPTFGMAGTAIAIGLPCSKLYAQAGGRFVMVAGNQVQWYAANGALARTANLDFDPTSSSGRAIEADEVQPDGSVLRAYPDTTRNRVVVVRIPADPAGALTLIPTNIPISFNVFFAAGAVYAWSGDISTSPAIYNLDGSVRRQFAWMQYSDWARVADPTTGKLINLKTSDGCFWYIPLYTCDYATSVGRMDESGIADTSFGTSGAPLKLARIRNSRDYPGYAALHSGAQHYYLYTSGQAGVARLNRAGKLDSSFGQSGQVDIGNLYPWSFTEEAQGKLLTVNGNTLTRVIITPTQPMPEQDTDGDGVPDAVEVTRGSSPLWRDNTPALTDPATMVRNAFTDVLNREPDAQALAFYRDAIAANRTSRVQLYSDLFVSDEFQFTMLPITRLYSATFVRTPDIPGLRYWQKRYAAGNESLDQIAELFATSPEFVANGQLNNTQYVTRLYQNILGREPDFPGLLFWTRQLDARLVTRGQLLARFSESPEYIATTRAKHWVNLAYLLILNLVPERYVSPYIIADQQATINDGRLTPRGLASTFAGVVQYGTRFVAECAVSATAPQYCPTGRIGTW